MVLDIQINTAALVGILIVLAIIPILTLMSMHHLLTYLSQNREKSKRILKVVSILLMIDASILLLHQHVNQIYNELFYIGVGLFIYACIATAVSLRKSKVE